MIDFPVELKVVLTDKNIDRVFVITIWDDGDLSISEIYRDAISKNLGIWRSWDEFFREELGY